MPEGPGEIHREQGEGNARGYQSARADVLGAERGRTSAATGSSHKTRAHAGCRLSEGSNTASDTPDESHRGQTVDADRKGGEGDPPQVAHAPADFQQAARVASTAARASPTTSTSSDARGREVGGSGGDVGTMRHACLQPRHPHAIFALKHRRAAAVAFLCGQRGPSDGATRLAMRLRVQRGDTCGGTGGALDDRQHGHEVLERFAPQRLPKGAALVGGQQHEQAEHLRVRTHVLAGVRRQHLGT